MVSVKSPMQIVVMLACACLLLSSSCGRFSQTAYSVSLSGTIVENGTYLYLVRARAREDGVLQPSPIIVRESGKACPVALSWEGGEWLVRRDDTKTVERRGSSVLLFQGDGQPLLELAPQWKPSAAESADSLREQVEALLSDILQGDVMEEVKGK